VVGEGVISACHFSETRVFDLFSHSYSYPWNCSWAQIRNSKHASGHFISRPLSLIIFKYQKSIHLFFLKCVRPERRRVGLLAWDTLNSNPPLLRSYYKKENFVFGEWPILCTLMSKEPSSNHQGNVSIIASRRSLRAGNDPQGPQSMTRGGVGTVVP
jgi:hypothetical protein